MFRVQQSQCFPGKESFSNQLVLEPCVRNLQQLACLRLQHCYLVLSGCALLKFAATFLLKATALLPSPSRVCTISVFTCHSVKGNFYENCQHKNFLSALQFISNEYMRILYIYMCVCVRLCVCLSPFLQSLSQLSHHCQSLFLFFLCTDEKQTVNVISQFLRLCSKPAVAETGGKACLAWAADA